MKPDRRACACHHAEIGNIVERDAHLVCTCPCQFIGVACAKHQHGERDPAVTEGAGFGRGRHRQPFHAARCERPAHHNGPAAVGKVLYNRHYAFSLACGAADFRNVVQDVVERNLDAGVLAVHAAFFLDAAAIAERLRAFWVMSL